MKHLALTLSCLLLTELCLNNVLSAPATTVRPYKFGFTIEEQQHRAEQRDERGIVMGEFGFITADGIYHVTVYATDENGKFRILSMKNYPYVGHVSATTPTVTTTTPRTTPLVIPKSKIPNLTVACSGCFLKESSPTKHISSTISSVLTGNSSHKTDIRPLSQPLLPSAAVVPGKLPSSLYQIQIQPEIPTGNHMYIDKGINVQLPFQLSIAQTTDAAIGKRLHEIQTTSPKELGHENAYTHLHLSTSKLSGTITNKPSSYFPQATSEFNGNVQATLAKLPSLPNTLPETKGVGATRLPEILDIMAPIKDAVGNTFDSEHKFFDLASLPKILPAATGTKDLNSNAFGESSKSLETSTVHQPLISSKLEHESQLSLGAEKTTYPHSVTINLESLPKISPAAPGAKDLSTYVFGTLPKSSTSPTAHQLIPSSRPEKDNPYQKNDNLVGQPSQSTSHYNTHPQHNVNVNVAKFPHSNINFALASRVNSNVIGTINNMVLPLSHIISKQSQNIHKAAKPPQHNRPFAPGLKNHVTLPNTQKEHTFKNTQSNTHTASQTRPLLNAQLGQVASGLIGNTNEAPLTATKKSMHQPPVSSVLPSNVNGSRKDSPATLTKVTANDSGPIQAVQANFNQDVAKYRDTDLSEPGQVQTGDLYRFKYTLDYNGHEETGSINGDKQGKYFAIGDDAVERTVAYIANELGFQPHISWKKLDKNDIALPMENSLKHNEFKWFSKA